MFSKLKDKFLNDDIQVPYKESFYEPQRNVSEFTSKAGFQSTAKEYAELKAAMMKKNFDDDPETWNWICGKLAYFQIRGLARDQYKELCLYAIQNCLSQYTEYFDDFIKIVADISYITAVCEQLLLEQCPGAARKAANPCLAYLMDHKELYGKGQLCFSSMEEAVLYAAEHGDSGENRAKEDYAGFFLCYARILLWRIRNFDDLSLEDQQNAAYCLDQAERLSPCNASMWELRATMYRETDHARYMEFIEKALLYSVTTNALRGLGAVYTNLAVFYSSQNYALANALCKLSSKFGGDPEVVQFALSGCTYDPYPDVELAVHQAGIQVGYSSLARMAQTKADEFRAREGKVKEERDGVKVILTASDSNYQYEVRDPMTVVGRSSAMSEYLKKKPTVSRVHARLVKEDDQLFVSDMDAMNGTYVNGIRIGPHRQELHEGDELRLGSSSERGARFTMKTEK